MKLHRLVATSDAVADTSSRLEKIRRLAELLQDLSSDEIRPGVAFLSGRLPRGKIGVGPATLNDALPVEPVEAPALTLEETRTAFRRIGAIEGSGAVRRREEALRDLFGRATAAEQDFLARLLLGELRHGAREELLVEAVAEAAGADAAEMRRAVMVSGDAGEVARRVLEEGPGALSGFSLRLFRPVKPMLAQTAEGPAEALERLGRAAFEYKFDGVRLQIHKRADRVRVFSRRLKEHTESLPDVLEAVRGLTAGEVVVDGEALSLREDGRPRPFQETMRRFGRTEDVDAARRSVPLRLFLFDCLWRDGESLLDRPASRRFEALSSLAPEDLLVPRIVTGDPGEANAFLREAISAGHEGVLAKALDAPYSAGRRGHHWLKLKPTYTADLVILAAEWGHGRRRGWLSNVHLGARIEGGGGPERVRPDPEGPYPDAPGFAMVGKTFKGMTDEMLERQTERLLELETRREGDTVYVAPDLVAEVAFDGVQESPTYRSGVALRFARVKGYRPDKAPGEADTLRRLRRMTTPEATGGV